MLPREYKTITGLQGPLLVVEKVADVCYDELVEIELSNGEHRRGRVLEIDSDKALVQETGMCDSMSEARQIPNDQIDF